MLENINMSYWLYLYCLYLIYNRLHFLRYGYYTAKTVRYLLSKKKVKSDIEEDWIYIPDKQSCNETVILYDYNST